MEKRRDLAGKRRLAFIFRVRLSDGVCLKPRIVCSLSFICFYLNHRSNCDDTTH